MTVYRVQYWKTDHWVSAWAGLSFERAQEVLRYFETVVEWRRFRIAFGPVWNRESPKPESEEFCPF